MSELFPLVTPAVQVKIERPRFLIENLIPLDVLTLLTGIAGEGKSSLALHWAAGATKGRLPGEFYGQPIQVAISATEDAKGIQIARLIAAGADLNKVTFLDMGTSVAGETIEQGIIFPRDMIVMRQALDYTGARLWIIDPVTGIIPGDSNSRDAVRTSLDPLHALARDLHISVLGVAHFNKGQGRARDKISGSHAFRDVARAHIPLVRDEESGHRIYTLEKSNYSTQVGQSWHFDLADTQVTTSDGQTLHVGRVIDLGESDITVDQVINRGAEESDRDEIPADEWLEQHLTLAGGEAKASDILRAANEDGYSRATIYRAQKKLGIRSQRDGFKGSATWCLTVSTPRETTTRETPGKPLETQGKVPPEVASCLTSQSETPLPVFGPEHLGTVVFTHIKYGDIYYTKLGLRPSTANGLAQWQQDGQPALDQEAAS